MAGRTNGEGQVLSSCFGKGPRWGGVWGVGEEIRGPQFSNYLHKGKKGNGTDAWEWASHFATPHVTVFLLRFVLLTVLD